MHMNFSRNAQGNYQTKLSIEVPEGTISSYTFCLFNQGYLEDPEFKFLVDEEEKRASRVNVENFKLGKVTYPIVSKVKPRSLMEQMKIPVIQPKSKHCAPK